MATSVQRRMAAEDLNAKLRLEARLRPRVDAIHRDLVRRVIRSLGNAGVLPDVAAIEWAALEPELFAHYVEVADVFDGRVDRELPADVKADDEEKANVAAALLALAESRAPEQAAVISENTRRDAQIAATEAESERLRQAAVGEPFGQRDVALVAGAVLGRRLRGRTGGIVTLETQAMAEAAKLAEVEVLMGVRPSEPGQPGAVPKSRTTKTWVSQGDSRVRDAHLGADGQERPLETPFDVGGQRLRHPGDTSLGATIDNVINCRCSSIEDIETIVDARRST